MPARYIYTARVSFRGDAEIARKYVGVGRALLGQLMNRLAESARSIGYMRRELLEVDIDVSYGGNDPTIVITGKGNPAAQPPLVDTINVWVPLGFVVYPASDSAAEGWGLPIVQDGSVSSTDPKNLAPGLDVTRWTASGGLGQVLLTRVAKAGYPAGGDILPPLLFNANAGLKPKSAKQGAELDPWTGYRLELTAYRANSTTGTATEASQIASSKESEFALINTHRGTASLPSINRPLRGYYDVGQNTAEMEFTSNVLAHYAGQLPDTYQTPEDRAGHDGTSMQVSASLADDRNKTFSAGEILYASALGNVIGTDPNGEDIDELAPGPDANATAAYNFWLSSPPHRAIVEGTEFTSGNSFLYPGFKHTVACVEFMLHEQWINTGTQYWYSVDATVPAISWYSPHNMNLTWETWPVNIDESTPPLIVRQPFVLPFDDEGLCWLQTYYSPDQAYPAWDNRIFCRGRCIAIAPFGGLVWAAAVQSFTLNNVKVYRLIALVHNQADQPTDQLTPGMTQFVHVWYCDIPFNLFAANPQTVIRGVFGQEDDSWPWITRNSPFSWKDAGVVDVSRPGSGGAPSLLKYTSAWRFSSDGTRAVCLRDVGVLSDYASVYDASASIGSGYFQSTGRMPAALELIFGQASNGSLTVDKNYIGLSPNSNPQPAGTDPLGGENVIRVMWPLAVDYDADSNIVAAFSVQQADAALMPPFIDVNSRTENGRWFVAFGFYNTAPSIVTPVGAYLSAPDQPVHSQLPVILDVNDGVFISIGTRTAALATTGSDDIGIDNPDFSACFSLNQYRVQTVRQGVVVDTRWITNTTSTLLTVQDVTPWFSGSLFQLSGLSYGTQQLITASYAKNRGGDWVLSYNLIPQPQISLKIVSSFDCATDPLDFPRVDPVSGLAYSVPADAVWLGGWTTSSFLAESALHGAVGTTGTNPRFLYARVV